MTTNPLTSDRAARRTTPERYRRPDPVPRPGTSGLPAGPRWPAPIQALALFTFRHWTTPWLHRRYGDPYTVSMPPHGTPMVVFSRPEHVREIFAADASLVHAGEANLFMRTTMGDHSILMLDEREHARARRLLTPAFSGPALRGYQSMIADVARAEVDTWRSGTSLSALDRMNALTLEVMLKVVFGVEDAAQLSAMRPIIARLLSAHAVIALTMDRAWLHRFGPWRRNLDTALDLDDMLYAVIAERRNDPTLSARTDVLSRLLLATGDGQDGRLSDAELRDQLITLLLAGHETTATALAWALQEVGRSPALVDRTVEAARSGDVAWLEAVFKESLRLHPPLPIAVRVLTRATTIGGVDLPAGVAVATSIMLAHANPDSYADVDTFRPERFIGGGPAPNTWLPFGGGVRRCIGAAFSQVEAVQVLQEIFTRYEIRALAPEPPRIRNITSVPRRGARISPRALT